MLTPLRWSREQEDPALVLCHIVACEALQLITSLRTEAQIAYCLAAFHAEVIAACEVMAVDLLACGVCGHIMQVCVVPC